MIREINTGVEMSVIVETSGYDGGDASMTTVVLSPSDGFQSAAGIHSHEGILHFEGIYRVSFTARGDMELNALREALRAATEMLDGILS